MQVSLFHLFEPLTSAIPLFSVPYETHYFRTFITLNISMQPGHYDNGWSLVFDCDDPSSLVHLYFRWAKRLTLDPRIFMQC